MKILKSIVLLLAGTAFGISFVLSCGDETPRSDAATCDCPSSEPPIAGRIVILESNPVTIEAGAQGGAGRICDPGMQFISGSCSTINPFVSEDVILQQTNIDKATGGWSCLFKNNKTVPVQVKATLVCLKPAT